MAGELKKLFEPGQIGKMTIKNRFVMSPMGTHVGKNEGVSDIMKDYYEARAKGGTGLIIVEALIIDFPEGGGAPNVVRIDDDSFVPGLSELVEVVHKHGAKVVPQLMHLGPCARQAITKMQPVGASAIQRPPDLTHPGSSWLSYSMPRELSIPEIKKLIAKYVSAARRSMKAGFDGVEIHAAHRYLLNSFLSPYWNQRKDEYGGDLKNRARFLLEVIAAVRQELGADTPILCRINSEERDITPKGIVPQLAVELSALLRDASVDAIDLSVNLPHSPAYKPGHNVEPAYMIKKVFGKPVIAVGVLDANLGEQVLQQGKADFICMGRSLIADPELPNKAAAGRLEDITPCLRCNSCIPAGGLECAVNAALKQERAYTLVPAEKPKKVVVIGGGPGGMEAARVAALRGHQVTLFEKERRLGGQLVLASVLRKENETFVNYLKGQLVKLKVNVELGKALDVPAIEAMKPDYVLVATGATALLPDIPGINSEKVLSSADIYSMMNGHSGGARKSSFRRTIWKLGFGTMRLFGPGAMRRLTDMWLPLGNRIVVVGLGLPGLELADFLAERGKQVTLVDAGKERTAEDPPMPVMRTFYNGRLDTRKVVRLAEVKYKAVTDTGLDIIDKTGKAMSLPADTIVFAADYKSNSSLYEALSGKAFAVRKIGDCNKPVGIKEAVKDGSRFGREI